MQLYFLIKEENCYIYIYIYDTLVQYFALCAMEICSKTGTIIMYSYFINYCEWTM